MCSYLLVGFNVIILFLLVTISNQFHIERYENTIKNISLLLQMKIFDYSIKLQSDHNYFQVEINDIKMISPINEIMNVSYGDDNNTSIINVTNVIFTFVSNVTLYIKDYPTTPPKINDLLFQLSYDSISFDIRNEIMMNVSDFYGLALYYSKKNLLGELKSFLFVNEDEDNQNKICLFFHNIVKKKYIETFNISNLIEYDFIEVIEMTKEYFNSIKGKQIESEDDIIRDLEIKQYICDISRIINNTNTLELHKLEIEFHVYAVLYDTDFKFSVKLSDMKFSHVQVDLNKKSLEIVGFSDGIVEVELINVFEREFGRIHKLYFSNIS